MAINLTNFKVEKLHGRRSITIPIQDNKLILVGENGSGKTTIINLLYNFLSRQWNRLYLYDFQSIEITINNCEKILVTKEQLKKRTIHHKYLIKNTRNISNTTFSRFRKAIDSFLNNLQHQSFKYKDNNDYIEHIAFQLSREFDIPRSMIIDYLSESIENDLEDTGLAKIDNKIEELVKEQILYLPTYRRIEQDLKTIFPNIGIDHELLHKRFKWRQDKNYIELVEFGMEDVVNNINNKMNELKEFIRSELNKLTGSYLREVISGEYKSFKIEDIERISAEAIDSIITRIGEDILPDIEKERMRKILGEIKSKQEVTSDHKVIAHFLLKLIQVYEAQQKNEKNIRHFVDVCNQYLSSTNKKIIFDNNNFNISIVLDSEENDNKIKIEQLSSGEKQIVSLFSHLFLSGIDKFFVLIDEPELSLSVIWQKKFLADILNIGHCTGLIAVTHSPFIFDNELEKFTHSLNEFLD